MGRIDFVLANAGIAEQTRIDTGDPELWRAVIETNLLGVIYTVHAVLPTMIEQNSGHVIVMSSTSGREPYRGEPVYQASKWGQIGFSHALRLELQGTDIRVRQLSSLASSTRLWFATRPPSPRCWTGACRSPARTWRLRSSSPSSSRRAS